MLVARGLAEGEDDRVERPAAEQTEHPSLDALASFYVVRLTGDARATEREAIHRWIGENPHHAVAFARAEAAWEIAERLKALPPPVDVAQPPNDAWLLRRNVIGGLVAACAVGVVGVSGWRYARDVTLYRTKVGERRVVPLADGSKVHLNTASTIEVAMNKVRRQVRLVKGEAMFEVAHDPARPFYVDAATARLRAIGTAFNVRLRQDIVELTVTEGEVSIASSSNPVHRISAQRIAAGDGAVIHSDAVAETALGDEALHQRTAWQNGAIEFRGETLAQAVEEFNRYQSQPIVIGDARLANIRIGGRFQVDEAEAFLTALKSSFPIDVNRGADGSIMLTMRLRDSSVPG